METSDWWQNSQQISKFEPFMKTVEELFPDSGLTPEEEGADFKQTATEQAIKAFSEVNQ
ncbi:MAG: hypothetical protein JKX81_14355 [Arenicella sp.]|nr:hypothetical protein [Arenicella sp.]